MVDDIGINFLILKELYFIVGLNVFQILLDANVKFVVLEPLCPASKCLLAILRIKQKPNPCA